MLTIQEQKKDLVDLVRDGWQNIHWKTATAVLSIPFAGFAAEYFLNLSDNKSLNVGDFIHLSSGLLGIAATGYMAAVYDARHKKLQEIKDTILNNLNDIVIILDPKTGNVLSMNSTGYEKLGYTSDEIINQPLKQFSTFLDSTYEDRIAKIEKDKIITTESVFKRKDGSRIPIETSSRLITLDGKKVVISLARDITERKTLEKNLEKKDFWIEEAQRISNIGSYILDFKTGMWTATEQLQRIFGISKDYKMDILGWSEIVSERAREEMMSYFERIIKEQRPFDKEYPITRLNDGVERILQGYGKITYSANGTPLRMIGSIQDVTDAHLTEEKLRKAQTSEQLSIIASGVAHDLEKILGPTVTLTGIVELNTAEIKSVYSATLKQIMALDPNAPSSTTIDLLNQCNAEINKRLTKINDLNNTMRQSGTRTADIVGDLISLTKSSEFEAQAIDLNRVIRNFGQSAIYTERILSRKDIKTTVNLESELMSIMGDENRLEKVIINIAINACDAMKEGGILNIHTYNADFNISSVTSFNELIPRGEYVVLSIADTGCGIPIGDLPKICDPFFTNKKLDGSSGTGLGLSVVKGVITSHGGILDVVTKKGVGTNFLVYFPATKEPIKQQTENIHYKGNGESIMIIEDNGVQRHVASSLLEALNYKVMAAKNGHDALSQLETMRGNLPKLLILDMILEPKFDGLDTYREIHNRFGKIPVVVASGYSEDKRVSEVISLSGGRYMKKPYTLSIASLVIKEELDKQK